LHCQEPVTYEGVLFVDSATLVTAAVGLLLMISSFLLGLFEASKVFLA
jgi:hypothetical protein